MSNNIPEIPPSEIIKEAKPKSFFTPELLQKITEEIPRITANQIFNNPYLLYERKVKPSISRILIKVAYNSFKTI